MYSLEEFVREITSKGMKCPLARKVDVPYCCADLRNCDYAGNSVYVVTNEVMAVRALKVVCNYVPLKQNIPANNFGSEQEQTLFKIENEG